MNIKLCLFTSMVALTLSGCASKAEREFVNGCKSSSGLDSSTCGCIYDKLEKKYGEDSLKNNLYAIAQSEHFQNNMMQAGLQCARE